MKPDPLAHACHRCGAARGQKCKDYPGKGKAPCPARGQPFTPPAVAVEAPAAELPELPRDLFGRPIFGGDRKPRQAPLFDAEHCFRAGYLDKWQGRHLAEHDNRHYLAGWRAAARDMADDDRDYNCDPTSAWAQARAVGNVTD